MATEKVNVLVADDHLKDFAKLVEQSKQAGMKVENQLKEIGVISGSIDAAHIADLERLPGIAAVERQREIQIPPPESGVQATKPKSSPPGGGSGAGKPKNRTRRREH
jgi:hypothetical protein